MVLVHFPDFTFYQLTVGVGVTPLEVRHINCLVFRKCNRGSGSEVAKKNSWSVFVRREPPVVVTILALEMLFPESLVFFPGDLLVPFHHSKKVGLAWGCGRRRGGLFCAVSSRCPGRVNFYFPGGNCSRSSS